LNILNNVFKDTDVQWDVFVTKKDGDARQFARDAVAAGVDAVAVYGGDGTMTEAANGLVGSGMPVAILPGGTANVISIELGIPGDVTEAATLLTGKPYSIRPVDLGVVGDRHFFHLGLGIEGQMIRDASREEKDKRGMVAYALAMLKNISSPPVSHYTLTLDGKTEEVDGVNLMVTNFGSIGVAGLKLSHDIDISDGLLDVLVIRDVDLTTLLAAATEAVTSGQVAGPLLQWQVREVQIVSEPPQEITCDGEIAAVELLHARVVPGALRVIVPAEAANGV
jgi:YegS/Rv2252/BmrU family lipid kinase